GQPDAHVVLSEGTSKPSPALGATQQRLATALPGGGRVLIYPRDVRKLGATTNVQGALARKHGARFVHVEMSRTLRDRLIGDAASRPGVGAAMAGSLAQRRPRRGAP